MKINNKEIKIHSLICLVLYYSIGQYLPSNRFGKSVRTFLCKRIFKKCGNHVKIERRAWFGSVTNVELSDYSGIGINCHIPSDTIIGNYVMMGPNCFILDVNHDVSDTSKPMCFQGMGARKTTIIDEHKRNAREKKITQKQHISSTSIIQKT